jgi:BsaWI-like restriction endonuclease
VELHAVVNKISVIIDLPGVTEAAHSAAGLRIDTALADPEVKNREVICDSFLELLRLCPTANASDLWHHIVYRLYCEIFPKHRNQDPKQSWVRASGDALESAIEKIYIPVLAPQNIQIQALISREQKSATLAAMGLEKEVGDSKLDVAVRLYAGGGKWVTFGGVHVKASLAERVSDDIPASRAMMKSGYFSPLWTLDVKSFPPPTGDLVNRGELGTPSNPSEKRKYVESHGDFDNCYSANARSAPSEGQTRSGKRICSLSLATQPDQFAQEVIARAAQWKAKK